MPIYIARRKEYDESAKNRTSGQSEILYWRYTPRTDNGRTGAIPVATVIVWMEEASFLFRFHRKTKTYLEAYFRHVSFIFWEGRI